MRFSEILLAATVITGFIWAIDIIFLRPRRMMNVLSVSKGSYGKEPLVVEYARSFFPVLLVVFILRSFLAEPFRIPSGSMRPTLLEGDFILVNKFDYGIKIPVWGTRIFNIGLPKRGDVIVFKHNKEGESIDMIKRVVGLPNDHIQYKDKMLYINGDSVKQTFQEEKMEMGNDGLTTPVRHQIEYLGDVKHDILVHPNTSQIVVQYPHEEVVVPPNSYFVMGDNRDNSRDSRYWGFVKDEDIQGRAFAIWMSWDSENHTIRWHRLMTPIQ